MPNFYTLWSTNDRGGKQQFEICQLANLKVLRLTPCLLFDAAAGQA